MQANGPIYTRVSQRTFSDAYVDTSAIFQIANAPRAIQVICSDALDFGFSLTLEHKRIEFLAWILDCILGAHDDIRIFNTPCTRLCRCCSFG